MYELFCCSCPLYIPWTAVTAPCLNEFSPWGGKLFRKTVHERWWLWEKAICLVCLPVTWWGKVFEAVSAKQGQLSRLWSLQLGCLWLGVRINAGPWPGILIGLYKKGRFCTMVSMAGLTLVVLCWTGNWGTDKSCWVMWVYSMLRNVCCRDAQCRKNQQLVVLNAPLVQYV